MGKAGVSRLQTSLKMHFGNSCEWTQEFTEVYRNLKSGQKFEMGIHSPIYVLETHPSIITQLGVKYLVDDYNIS